MDSQSELTFKQITPEPTPEELAAIVGAVTTLSTVRNAMPKLHAPLETSRWAKAGRLAQIEPLSQPLDSIATCRECW